MNTNFGKYSLRNLKTFNGMEGQGFNATLLCDGKPVAEAIDDGNGGCLHIRWLDQTGPLTQIECTNYQNKPFLRTVTAAERALIEFTRTLPPEDVSGIEVAIDEEIFISDLVGYVQESRRLARMLKAKIMTVSPDGEIREFPKAKPTPANIAAIQAKYPDRRVLNALPVAEAFTLFLKAA